MSDIEFTELELTPTGAVECTDLTDVDRAVRGFFGRVIDSMVVTDTERKENKEFKEFQDKPITGKLHIGQFDDPHSFLRELASKSGGNKKEFLPTCYLSRDPSIVYCDGDDYTDMRDFADLTTSDGKVYAKVSKSFVKLTYTLTTLAWNKETCSRLALGLSMRLRKGQKGRPHKFKAKSMIAGAPVSLYIEINQPTLAVGTAIPASFADSRLSGVSFDFEVIAEVLEAEAVDVRVKTFKIGLPELM